jgi:hypothetical protein
LIFNLCQTISRDTVDWNSFLGSKLFVVFGVCLGFLGEGGRMGEKTFLGSENFFWEGENFFEGKKFFLGG